MKTVLSDDELLKIYEEGGKNTTLFAKSTGVTRAVAESFLKRKGWYQKQNDRHADSHPDVLAAYLETGKLSDTAKKTGLTPAVVVTILNKILPDWREKNARPQSNKSPYTKDEMLNLLISTGFRPHKTVTKIGKSYRRWCKQLGINIDEEQKKFEEIINQPNLENLVGTTDERYLAGLDGYQELRSFKVLSDNIQMFYEKSLSDISTELSVPIIHVKNFRIKKDIPVCEVSYSTSKPEVELANFVKTMAPNAAKKVFVVDGVRREVDIFVPDKGVGIEFNGSYYHSDLVLPDGYHKQKNELLEKVGVRLIHVFEHQWQSKPDIVKSKIRHALGFTTRRIDARKCKIADLSSEQYRNFCDANHIQGSVPASIKKGLFYGSELVAVISFGKPRFGGKHDFELLRACTKIDTVVRGGISRLFHHVVGELPTGTKIMSYNNDMIGTGMIYKTLGFGYLGKSPPSFFYANGHEFVTRYQAQKHKLKDTKGYRDDLSEREIMRANGFFRIYDCGVSKYEYVVKGKNNE